MEFMSGLVTVLLTMAGYSIGAVLAGKDQSPAPKLLDLGALTVLWVFIFLVRPALGHWLAVGVTLIVSGVVSFALHLARRDRMPAKTDKTAQSDLGQRLRGRVWQRWKAFATQMGNYQGRMSLAVFYFVVVTPFGLLVRLFSDPLRTKFGITPSFWANRPAIGVELDEARRQF